MLTVASLVPVPWWTVPLTGAVKPDELAAEPAPDPDGPLALPEFELPAVDTADWRPSRLGGVPARLAQSWASGPPGSQTRRPSGSRAEAPSALARAPA